MKNNITIDRNIDYTLIPTAQRVDKILGGIIEWLDEYEGKGHYALGGYGIYFEREEDAAVFALKWS